MKYKGYEAIIKYSDADQTFISKVINTRNMLVFDGNDVKEVEMSFHAVVDDYLEDCEAENKTPNKPFSGQFVMRVSPDLHRELFVKARQADMSLNAFNQQLDYLVHTG